MAPPATYLFHRKWNGSNRKLREDKKLLKLSRHKSLEIGRNWSTHYPNDSLKFLNFTNVNGTGGEGPLLNITFRRH